MHKSLINSFLGILTTSEVHELIDVFKGKGRRPITPFLEEFLDKIDEENGVSVEDSKKILLHQSVLDFNEEKKLEHIPETPEGGLKGVLFILDSFKKTKKYQQLLKSREVLNLYGQTSSQAISGQSENEASGVAKSKGILINKKHF